MRDYVVVYCNALGEEVLLTVQAVSAWVAKWIAVSEHGVQPDSIKYAL